MKTCFLSYNLMKTSVADYFIGLSNELAKDYNIVVITSKIKETNIELDKSITVLKWPSNRPTSWKDFWFLYKLSKQYKPSIMISLFGSVNLFLIVGWLFRVKNRVAWLRTLSSQYPQKRFKVFRKRFMYKLATTILANSLATKNDAIDYFKIAEHKITVLPNSVKDYSSVLPEIITHTDNLLYVGRLHRSKGIDVLLYAFSKVLKTHPELHLDIIGQGSLLDELIGLASSLRISDKVSFLGEKNKETVLKSYKKSYCTIIPSNFEAFGFTVIEAMSVGTCVIGANNSGIKEIIVHDESGLLFETGNSDDLVEKLEIVIKDVDYRNNLAKTGYKRFINYYESSIAVNRDANFFKKLVDK